MRRAAGVFLLTAAFAAPTVSSAQTVTIGVGGQLSALAADTFRVPIYADMRGAPGERLGSYTIRVAWDPAVLVYAGFDSTSVGTFAAPTIREDSAGLGVLVATAASAVGKDGVFDLIQLRLRMFAAGTSVITLQVRELSAATTFTNLLPFVTVVNGTFCPAVGRWGDLDADAVSNSRDALAVLSSVVGLPTPGFTLSLGDVDGDGLTNSRDALIVLSYAVGLQVPGQRVLLVAPGPCVTAQTPTLEVLPATADLVVRQEVQLQVLARNAAGIPSTLTGVNWAVTNLRVAHVDPHGRLVARDTGSTTVTAELGPGVRVTGQVIVRARRGTWRVDATRAAMATVQLGTSQYPFSTPEFAFAFLSEGDTIRIAPGVHDYLNVEDELTVGAVIIGDTLANGTRPVLRAPGSFSGGFDWRGGERAEIKHLVLRDFQTPIYLNGLRNLLVENVRIEDTEANITYGYGIYGNRRVDTLRVLRSEFEGDSTDSYYGIELDQGAHLVVISDSKFRRWQSGGIYAYNVDSLDVRNSLFEDLPDYGIYLSTGGGGTGTGSTALTLSRSRFVGTTFRSLYASEARTVAMDHNYIDARYYQPLYINGCCATDARLPQFTSRGDSIRFRSSGYYWIEANDLDTARIDSLWFQSPADTVTLTYGQIEANYLRVSHARFLNLAGQAVNFRGRTLVVDSSEFIGCAACTWADGSYAVQAYANNDSGPIMTVRRSTFYNLYVGIYSLTSGDSAGPMLIANNTMDSVQFGVDVNADSVVASDNLLTRIGTYGIRTQPSYSARPLRQSVLLRNQVTCSINPLVVSYGLQTYNTPARIEDNGVRGCVYGIQATNNAFQTILDVSILRDTVFVPSTAFYHVGIRPDYWVRPVVSGNRVVGGYIGIDVTLQDTGTVRLDSNAVSGAGFAGVQLYFVLGPASGIRNNITNNLQDGLFNAGGGPTRSFTLGRFAGNVRAGVNNAGAGTIDATQNWWGTSAGANQTGSDATMGLVDATNHLTVEPTDVPPPAPSLAAALSAGLRRAVARESRAPMATARPGPGVREDDRLDARRATLSAEQAAHEARIRARRADAARIRQQAQAEQARRKLLKQ